MKKNMFKTVLVMIMLATLIFCVFAATVSANQLKNRLTERIGMAAKRESVTAEHDSGNIDSGSDGFIDDTEDNESSPLAPVESVAEDALTDASDAVDNAVGNTNGSMKSTVVKVIVIVVIVTALAGVVAFILLKKK